MHISARPQFLWLALHNEARDVDSHLDCVIHVADLVTPRPEATARIYVSAHEPGLDELERCVHLERGHWIRVTKVLDVHRGYRRPPLDYARGPQSLLDPVRESVGRLG